MALTRARVVSASPAFARAGREVIQDILRRPRDAELIAGDVVEMRAAIAKEKGDSERWDLKYAAGGLVDLEFIAQYLQLVHAHELPEILDTSTARVLDKAWQLSCCRSRMRKSCARRCSSITTLRRSCGSVCRARSIRRRRAPGCCDCWRARPTCRISPRSMRP